MLIQTSQVNLTPFLRPGPPKSRRFRSANTGLGIPRDTQILVWS